MQPPPPVGFQTLQNLTSACVSNLFFLTHVLLWPQSHTASGSWTQHCFHAILALFAAHITGRGQGDCVCMWGHVLFTSVHISAPAPNSVMILNDYSNTNSSQGPSNAFSKILIKLIYLFPPQADLHYLLPGLLQQPLKFCFCAGPSSGYSPNTELTCKPNEVTFLLNELPCSDTETKFWPFIPDFLISFCVILSCSLTHCALVFFQFPEQIRCFPTLSSCTPCSFCLECLNLPRPFFRQLAFPPTLCLSPLLRADTPDPHLKWDPSSPCNSLYPGTEHLHPPYFSLHS